MQQTRIVDVNVLAFFYFLFIFFKLEESAVLEL